MRKNVKITILNLPSPPYQEMCRDWAGGFGTSVPCSRDDYGQSHKTIFQPFLPYVSSFLSKGGYEFKVLDCQKMKMNQFQVLSAVKIESPDIVVSTIGLPSLKKDIELLNKIKESLQNVFIVGIGTICSVIPSEVLLESSVDVVLRSGYPYISNLIDLVQAFQQSTDLKRVHGISYVKNKKVISTPKSFDLNLGEIPPPSYDFLDVEGYETFTDITGERYPYVPILESKGCPYQCIYCPYPIGFGKKWSYRSPKEIADEIEYLYFVRGINGFLMRGQSFGMNDKFAINMCNEIIRRKLDIAWFCEARVDQVTRELLEKMKKAGCKEIHYGVETGDPEVMKTAKPGVNLGTIRKTFRLTKEIGLLTTAHIILGWPDDNLETINRTYKFILELDPDSVNWNVLTPYPKTKIYQIAQKDSLIATYNWSNYTSHTVVMRTKYLSVDQLTRINKIIVHNFTKQKLMTSLKKPRLFIKETRNFIRNVFLKGNK